jgi:hypothetical protein
VSREVNEGFSLRSGNSPDLLLVPSSESGSHGKQRRNGASMKERRSRTWAENGLDWWPVILGMGVPLGALYTYYRVRKLRSAARGDRPRGRNPGRA